MSVKASSPNEVIFICLISFTHFSHLSSRLSVEAHWNRNTSVSFATPARSCKNVRVLFQARQYRSFHPSVVSRVPLHEKRGCRSQHTEESFHTSCLVSLFLLTPLQYPVCPKPQHSAIRKKQSAHCMPDSLAVNAHKCRVQRRTSQSRTRILESNCH